MEHETPLIPDLSQAEQVLGAEAAAALRKLCLEYSDTYSDGRKGVAATTLLEAPVDTAKGWWCVGLLTVRVGNSGRQRRR